MRSDAAVKKLLAARCDELERLAGNAALVVQPSATSADSRPTAATPAAGREGAATGRGDASAEERCIELAWQLEEALAAGRAANAQVEALTDACAAAEQCCKQAQARADELEAAAQGSAALAEEAAARALSERKVLSKEVKQQRKDLVAAAAAREAAEAACGQAALHAATAVATVFQSRLSSTLREAAALRRRLCEATIEQLGAEPGTDPLELLALCDARAVALQAEAQLLVRIADAAPMTEPQTEAAAHAAELVEGQVREALAGLLSDQASLRRRVNSLLRTQLAPPEFSTPRKR